MSSLERQVLQACRRVLTGALGRVERRLAPPREPAGRPELSLQHAYENSWRGYPCVFVLSTGRVGTETLTALAALSPRVVAVHEPQPRLIKASFDAYLAGEGLGAHAHWRDVVLAARDDAVRGAARKGKVYVETNNRMTYLAPILAEVFPDSRFVHLYRDPYAFVRSAMRRRYFAGHDWDFARVRPRPGDPLAAEWDRLSGVECCAWLWARANHDARTWLATLPPSRRLALRSEDLFRGTPEVLAAFFNLCGVELPPAARISEVLGARLNAQQQGEFPDASAWSADDRESVWRHAGELASSLGYAPPETSGPAGSGAA